VQLYGLDFAGGNSVLQQNDTRYARDFVGYQGQPTAPLVNALFKR
jgi:hypothetical protein